MANCKVHLELNWIEECIFSTDGNYAKFEITDAKLHIRIVTFSTKDSVNLTKQLSEVLKSSLYFYRFQTKPEKIIEKGKILYELLNASIKGVRILFVLAFVVATGAANNEEGIKNNKQ